MKSLGLIVGMALGVVAARQTRGECKVTFELCTLSFQLSSVGVISSSSSNDGVGIRNRRPGTSVSAIA